MKVGFGKMNSNIFTYVDILTDNWPEFIKLFSVSTHNLYVKGELCRNISINIYNIEIKMINLNSFRYVWVRLHDNYR